MKPPRIVIGYVRVSTREQATEGVSLDAQREKISAYAKMHDHELLCTESDEGISGKRADNRPGLQKSLELVCQHKGVLVVHSLTRLGRSTMDCIQIVGQIEKCGADLASITEKIDTTSSMGRFVFRLMASLGELERDQISDRTKAAMSHKRSKGERIGKIPFGYELHEDRVHLVEVPGERTIMNLISIRRGAGESCRSIADWLNSSEVRSKHGGKWHPSAVHSVLKREKANA